MIQLLNVLTFRLEIIIVVNPHLLIMDSVIPVYIYIYINSPIQSLPTFILNTPHQLTMVRSRGSNHIFGTI
jgi:hypothetical protein